MKRLSIILIALCAIAFTACQNSGKPETTAQTEDTTKVIPKTDATVIVLLAHPDIAKSRANAALSKAAAEVKGVQVVNIYDYPVTPEAYKEVLTRAKAIVYEFPIYWMSAPHLMKQWTDEVFMVYTGEENLIKGKKFMVCCTTGSPKEAYQPGGANKYTIEEYLRPYEGQANHAEMLWQKPLCVYGIGGDQTDANIKKGCEEYKARLEALVKE